VALLDDALGKGFATLRAAGADRFVVETESSTEEIVDATGALRAIFASARIGSVVLRPDRYVAIMR
jgi:hypothetical protein